MKFSHFFVTLLVATQFIACTKDYSTELPANAGTAGGYSYGTAAFSLNGSPYACAFDSVLGVYNTGKLLDSTNRIVLSVLVDTTGTYTIYTTNQYGISFSGSGVFTRLGVQNISLYGSGAPSVAGTFNYTPGLNGCSFTVTITGGAIQTDCKSCIYMPTCQGSKYTYMDSAGAEQWSQRKADYISTADTTIDGGPFTRIISQAGYSYYSCSNGTTVELVYNTVPNFQGTTSIVEFKHIALESNAALGAAWISNVANSFGQNFSYVYRMAEKGITREVFDSVYNDILHVNTVINLTIGSNTSAIGSEDFYYARGIGLIEQDSSDYNGNILKRSLLASYSVPE